ncbi:putative rna methyltransferase [Erysiphe neolycopersici]|uniref:rRNA methyltransferase 1, mitochondrial n=1 Tax=Erysiphe neolycopersici TaxID=212602 RepID=A0A420HJW0_9PEZI|nr:putative rna methyltransferase [Erysiphe neolycopersici]
MTIFRSRFLLKLPTIRNYHIGTATTVHKAIRRGLIKSGGIAFRGKSNPDPDDPRELYKKKHNLPDFTGLPDKPYRKSNKNISYDSFRSGSKELQWDAQWKDDRRFSPLGQSIRSNIKKLSPPWLADLKKTRSLRETMKNDMDREAYSEESGAERINYGLLSVNRSPEFGRKQYAMSRHIPPQTRYNYCSPHQRETESKEPEGDSSMNRRARRAIQFGKTNEDAHSDLKPNLYKRNFYDNVNAKNRSMYKQERNERAYSRTPPNIQNDLGPNSLQNIHEITQNADQKHSLLKIPKSFPISVPYTTSASEFLYGTSVVESILSSKKTRRELYKLYIYSGKNQEDTDRDEHFQRLAKAKGIKVEKVSNDWIRILDKMSNGRPHNGYILETSPLPRLPVQCLGKVLTCEDPTSNTREGFEVQIDHQSREEASINGTMNFIEIQKSLKGRKPLVLLLDHVLDPGNMGGMIRTASFFGISAIAISTRNCAAITPIVSKASAGASESSVLMSVHDSVEFVTESKKAGWYVFAAVAPPLTSDSLASHKILSLSEQENINMLPDAPSIIMMGSEGDGLRQTLRSKADYQVYIPGYQESTVNSLNLSVATGIICHILSRNIQSSFISRKAEKPSKSTVCEQLNNSMVSETQQQQEILKAEEKDQSILF